MKPLVSLVTQKIEFGVRLKSDEIVGERQMPGKGGDGGGSGEREIKRARSASLRRPAYAAALYGSRPEILSLSL
jgi:hypothetical protein